jgi:hypothetical protein
MKKASRSPRSFPKKFINSWSEKDVRLAHNIQVYPCIPVGIHL